MKPLALTLQPEADDLLTRDPLALLLEILLDQQMPMERADADGARLSRPPQAGPRIGGDRLSAQDLAVLIVEVYDGDAAAIWSTAASGEQVHQRLESTRP